MESELPTYERASIPAGLRLQQLQAENARLKRVRELKESYGINFYRPHYKQHLFHTNIAKGRYLRTGNRFGKSECGICEDIAWCLGGRPWYEKSFDVLDGERHVKYSHVGYKGHPLVHAGIPNHAVKGLILVVDWDKTKEVFTNRDGSHERMGKLWRFLPKEAIGKVTNGGRGDKIIQVEIKRPREWGGGSSTLTFDTLESYRHNRMGAESSDWDFIHIDEPIPESMFKAHSRGLTDRNGSYWFTCTPLDEMWINDKFTPPGRQILGDIQDIAFEAEGLTRYIVTGSMDDNPHISVAGRQEFLSGLTPEEVLCRRHGLPLALAGAVYGREFVYDMHVLCDVPKGWEDYHLPPPNYTIRHAWDVHGARVPQAILFAATAPDGTVFIYDELFCEPIIGPNAELVKRKLKDRNSVSQIIDPRALIKNPVTETADVLEALMAHDLYYDPASKDLTVGISAVKEKLNERHVVTGLPTIFFSPRLKETLYEFSHYVYDLEKNEPKDKDDHMMENLYRLVLHGLGFIEPPNDKDWKRTPFKVGLDEFRKHQSYDFSPV